MYESLTKNKPKLSKKYKFIYISYFSKQVEVFISAAEIKSVLLSVSFSTVLKRLARSFIFFKIFSPISLKKKIPPPNSDVLVHYFLMHLAP